jgi:hypothetical protein
MTQIKKYEPMRKIIFKSEEVYIPEKYYDKFAQQIKENPIVDI